MMKSFSAYNQNNQSIITVDASNLEQAYQRVKSIFGEQSIGNVITRITETIQWAS